jgi:SPW repeat-containing protein
MAIAIRHRGQVATASGLDVLAGIWLLISPFVLAFRSHGGAFNSNVTGAVTNDVVLGIVIGLLALYRTFNAANNVWVSWLNVLLGIWVLISPWVVGFSSMRIAMTNNVIMGIIVIILAGWSALASSASPEEVNTGGPSM